MADLPDVDELPATGSRELHDWLLDAEERAANRFADEFASVVVRAARAYRSTLVAAGDVSVFDSVSTARLTAVLVGAMEDTWAVGAVASMGASGLPAVLTAPWAASVNETAVSYASTARNRVRGLAEESWLEVRGRLVDGLEAGMPNREFAAQVSDISGYGRGRAEAIARTEMVGAYNAGHEIGAEALPTEFAPAAKQWLATGGSRTRESHAMANGQVVAWGDTFTVGGSSMSRPHDPAGPAAEIVNCRCSLLVLYPGDPNIPESLQPGVDMP